MECPDIERIKRERSFYSRTPGLILQPGDRAGLSKRATRERERDGGAETDAGCGIRSRADLCIS